mgnify:CR=1 FL=1
MTQTQLVRELAEACGINNKAAKGMLECLANVAIRETKNSGVFVLPGIGRLVRADRKANCDFTRSSTASAEHQVRNIGASDQQNDDCNTG